MAPRPDHIPHATERSALQKLITDGPLPFFKLHPAGIRTVKAMLQKGWLVRESQLYKITEAGEVAFRAKIPANDLPLIPKGARVRFNELGVARSPKMPTRVGTVMKAASSNGVRIIFDGSLTPATIHRSYLEILDEGDSSATPTQQE